MYINRKIKRLRVIKTVTSPRHLFFLFPTNNNDLQIGKPEGEFVNCCL